MGPKEFKLEQVLSFRREVEKREKQEFAAAKKDFEGARDTLEREEAAIERFDDEFHRRQREGIDAVELQLYADFSMRKNLDIQMQRQTVETLASKMAQQRAVLLDAAKDKKVLEVFKEKRTNALRRELSARERNFVDEIMTQKRGQHKR